MKFPLLKTQADLEIHLEGLAKTIPEFAEARSIAGDFAIRTAPPEAGTLIRTIIGQQVSVASARAINQRLDAAGLHGITAIRAASFDELRAAGLSRQKATYLLALAEAEIDFDRLTNEPDDAVIETLTAVKGIGRWSAEIYLMFALGRHDAFCAGDLALQEGARLLFNLEARPSEKTLRKLSEDWSPHRNAAAQLLWRYYHVKKARDGIGV